MKIKNSEELYQKVSLGTPVKITYYTCKIRIKGNKIFVYKYPNIYSRKVDFDNMISDQLKSIALDYTLDLINMDKLRSTKNGSFLVIGELVH